MSLVQKTMLVVWRREGQQIKLLKYTLTMKTRIDVLWVCISVVVTTWAIVTITTQLLMQPLRNPQPNCWYKASPVGHNTLSATVRKLTACIGDGFFTNHSLRRTCATRLYEKMVLMSNALWPSLGIAVKMASEPTRRSLELEKKRLVTFYKIIVKRLK